VEIVDSLVVRMGVFVNFTNVLDSQNAVKIVRVTCEESIVEIEFLMRCAGNPGLSVDTNAQFA
jgi:hypothetical protein